MRLDIGLLLAAAPRHLPTERPRSEEHTSELQSQSNLVCRLLLEKKKRPGSPTPSCPDSCRTTPFALPSACLPCPRLNLARWCTDLPADSRVRGAPLSIYLYTVQP